MNMVTWVQSRTATTMTVTEREELLDPALKPLAPREESSLFEVLNVALQCTRKAPSERPSSRQVSDMLLHVSLKIQRVGTGKKVAEYGILAD